MACGILGKETTARTAHKIVRAPVLLAFISIARIPSGTVITIVANAAVNGAIASIAEGMAMANDIDPNQQPIL